MIDKSRGFGPAYSHTDVQTMAQRWESVISDLEYPSRRLAMRILYYLIICWLDGGKLQYYRDKDGYETLLSQFSGDVCLWLYEYPDAATRCPSLCNLQLNSPRLIDEAVREDH